MARLFTLREAELFRTAVNLAVQLDRACTSVIDKWARGRQVMHRSLKAAYVGALPTGLT